jgi:murein DD-endopeptidase MepM/ murein hydrolase activator NlpD
LIVIPVLDDIGILPEPRLTWLKAPFPPDYPIVITGEWLEIREDEDGTKRIHYGVDFRCSVGDPIVALADGKIIKPKSGTLMSRITGFGKHVWIEHPGGLYSVYAHLDKKAFLMIPGRKVKQGQEIGECGSTGRSTAPHSHIGVSDQHPNEFVLYGEQNPGWINPHEVRGTCRATVVE